MAASRARYGEPMGTYVLVLVPALLFLPALFVSLTLTGGGFGLAAVLSLTAVSAVFFLLLRLSSLPVSVTLRQDGIHLEALRRVRIYRNVPSHIPWGDVMEAGLTYADQEVTGGTLVPQSVRVRTRVRTFLLAAPPAQVEQWASQIATYLPGKNDAANGAGGSD